LANAEHSDVFLSVMLGVRRAGVTSATHVLGGTRAIRAERGLMRVVDRPAPERPADTTYGHAEAEHARLIVPQAHDRVLDIDTSATAN
jgi:hypothetical protein